MLSIKKYRESSTIESGRSAVRFSAPEWGSGGRWFESSRPDHNRLSWGFNSGKSSFFILAFDS